MVRLAKAALIVEHDSLPSPGRIGAVPTSGWKPIIDVLKLTGNRAKPHIPDWDEYTEKNIVPYLTEAWRQQKAPREALTEAARLANAWLDARPKA